MLDTLDNNSNYPKIWYSYFSFQLHKTKEVLKNTLLHKVNKKDIPTPLSDCNIFKSQNLVPCVDSRPGVGVFKFLS